MQSTAEGLAVSVRTLRKHLKLVFKAHPYMAPVRTRYSIKQRKKRLQYAFKMRGTDWRKYCFLDHKYVYMLRNNRCGPAAAAAWLARARVHVARHDQLCHCHHMHDACMPHVA